MYWEALVIDGAPKDPFRSAEDDVLNLFARPLRINSDWLS